METHQQTQLKKTNYSGDVVIGMSDGIIIPFALATGLSGVVQATSIVVIAGLAQITAGAIAMGFGGYFAGKSEHVLDSFELNEEIKNEGSKTEEKIQTKEFFANLGLSEELQEKAMEEVSKDKEKWSELVMKYDQTTSESKPATQSGITIGISYIAGGLIPLSPYIFLDNINEALKFSVIITLVCLLGLGWYKARLNGMNPYWGSLRSFIVGALAAAAAFGVARIFTSM